MKSLTISKAGFLCATCVTGKLITALFERESPVWKTVCSAGGSGYTHPMLLEGVPQHLRLGSCNSIAAEHHNIHPDEIMLPVTKTLTNDPFDPIAIDCKTQALFRYRQTQPPSVQTIRSPEYGEVLVDGSSGTRKNPTVGLCVSQTVTFVKSTGRRHPLPAGRVRASGGHDLWLDGH